MRDDEKNLNASTTAGTTTTTTTTEHHDVNPDPLTGEPGAHPVGTGVGAATGGTVGAVIGGAVGGPLGAMVGAAVGGVAGGLAGKGISESVNPTEEDAFWRDHYSTRPYYSSGRSYDDLQPAYRYGWEARTRHEDRTWNDIESDLGSEWNARHGARLDWNDARNATRDAWDRVDARHRFNTQEDNYWRSNYSTRPYASGRSYEDLQPAYRYGYESRYLNRDRDWNTAENDLERGWDKAKGASRSTWHEVKHAVKDSWDRVTDPHDLDNSRRSSSDVSNTTGYAGTSFTGGTTGTATTGGTGIGVAGAGSTETLNSPAGSHLTGQGGNMTAGSMATGTAATGLAGGTPSTITGWSGTGSTTGTSNWQNEDNYWRKNYSSRPYASGRSYDDLSPAYRYGYDSANQYRGRSWNEAENDLERGWDKAKGATRSTWHEVKDAVKDAWHRVERAVPGDADRDGR